MKLKIIAVLYTEGKISWKEFLVNYIIHLQTNTGKWKHVTWNSFSQVNLSIMFLSNQDLYTVQVTSTLTFSPMRFQVLEKSPLTLPKQLG